MNNTTTLVMVGGKSGVGKTTLVNGIIKAFPGLFDRPISYTTRKQRENEDSSEYIFTSHDEMDSLYQKSYFLNYDESYGEKYAISKESIYELTQKGIIPIKEIHPKNQKAMKARYPFTISVLIRTIDDVPVTNRDNRDIEDAEYYSGLDESQFDIVYINDRNIPINESIHLFGQRLLAYHKYRNRFPASKRIDMENAIGYSMIAKEFTEAKRITTHNFHTLSLGFFADILDAVYNNEDNCILELGPGQGWLRKSLNRPIHNYDILELTEEMAAFNDARRKIIGSASRMPICTESYDLVVSSLGDPYFYPETLCEVYRVLKHGGKFAFSLPDSEWAYALRGENPKTTFISDAGKSAETYSFVFNLTVLKELLSDCGFIVEDIQSLNGEKLIKGEDRISPAITAAAKNKGCTIDKLHIITMCLCRKE